MNNREWDLVTDEFAAKEVEIRRARTPLDKFDHDKLLDIPTVFALDITDNAKIYVDTYLTHISIAVPTTRQTGLYLINENSHDLTSIDYDIKEDIPAHKIRVVMDINKVEPIKNITKHTSDEIIYIDDHLYDNMMVAIRK